MVKKVLFVSNTSWSVYNFRKNLMKALKEEGFDVSFCASYDKYTDKLKKEGFKYIRVGIDKKGKNPFNDLKLIFDFYKIYKKEKIDLISHYTIKPNVYGSLAARITKTEYINTVTGLGSVFIKNNILAQIVKFFYRIVFRYSQKVFFQNRDDLNFFIKNKLIKKEKSILVRGSGVDTNYFHPNFCRRKVDFSFTFLFLGRILWNKGVDEFVKAAEIIRKRYSYSRFLLLGPIDRKDSSFVPEKLIEKWVKEKTIQYLRERDDVRKVICESDIVVLPSYYREGVPRSLLEAASMEKPIITTNVSGCKDVVEDNINGLICEGRNYKDLAAKMEKMINLKEGERIKMGKKGRERMKNDFDEKIVIKKYLGVINKIVNKLA